MNPRDEFFFLLEQEERAREHLYAEKNPLKEKLEEEYFRQYPRRKKAPSVAKLLALLGDTGQQIAEQVNDQQNLEFNKFTELKRKLTQDRLVYANLIDLAPSKHRTKYREVCETSYGSQGFGARSYARSKAKLLEVEARYFGLRAEVDEHIHKYETMTPRGTRKRSYATYTVYVYAEPSELKILEHKSMPLRETVKFLWSTGVNPRVYMPFLPHGYEKSQGLDLFGGEL